MHMIVLVLQYGLFFCFSIRIMCPLKNEKRWLSFLPTWKTFFLVLLSLERSFALKPENDCWIQTRLTKQLREKQKKGFFLLWRKKKCLLFVCCCWQKKNEVFFFVFTSKQNFQRVITLFFLRSRNLNNNCPNRKKNLKGKLLLFF